MYETIKSRLARFANHLQIPDQVFEKSVGMSNGNLQKNGDIKGLTLARVFTEYPQLSPDWLINGTGPMIRPIKEHPSVIEINPVEQASEPVQPYKAAKRTEQSVNELLIATLQAHIADLQKQLENKDAQIATLFTVIK